MGKHELKNKKDEGKWNWALLAANVLLTLCFAAIFWPILHKGSLSFLDKTSNLRYTFRTFCGSDGCLSVL